MADFRQRWAPLRYRLHHRDDMTLLAHQPEGAGRVVELFGELHTASRFMVLVPGNTNRLATYRGPSGDAPLRTSARRLHRLMSVLAPEVNTAVIAWLGYRCPVGLFAAASRAAAREAREDLVALTNWLPAGSSIGLVGHSYGSVVCGLAAAHAPIDDLVSLGGPGFGVRTAAELATPARVWAAVADRDWVQLLPRGQVASLGHSRLPTDRRFGATVFRVSGARGHSGYYTTGSECLTNLARIGLGRYDDVTVRFPTSQQPVRSPVDHGERMTLGDR